MYRNFGGGGLYSCIKAPDFRKKKMAKTCENGRVKDKK